MRLMSSLPKSTPWILLSWFLLNLIQAGTTGLMNDETYYWVYTQFPDWGYLDHPPAIMVMIAIGELLGHGPVFTRLLTAILSTASLSMLMQLMPGKSLDLRLFLPLFLSLPLFHVFGFITVPDAPLLFFTTLYFLALKAFLEREDWRSTLWLLVAVTGMIYAKYHAVLIIFFTLIALPRLFVHPKFYFIAAVSAVLYAPHILWQVQNDYPSIQYHLLERADVDYRIDFTTGYLLTQILVLGPLSFWIVFRAAGHFLKRFPTYSNDPAKRFLRVMQVQFWGFLGFFLLMSFRGLVEGNWTAPMLIPAVVLTYVYLSKERSAKLRRISIPLFWGSTGFVMLLRFLVAVPLGEFSTQGQLKEFHFNKQKALEIQQELTEYPIVFYDGYKHPSRYWYYTGIPAHAESSIRYRLTQYDAWPLDTLHWGETVYWVGGMPKKEKFGFQHSFGDSTRYMIDSAYYSLNTLRVDVELPAEWSASSSLPLVVQVTNESADSVHFPDAYPVWITSSLKVNKAIIDTVKLARMRQLDWGPGETRSYEVVVDRWPEPGAYLARVSLQKDYFHPTLTGPAVNMILTE
ncbi:glycosyltransferase family 39 protein [Cryomorphaceae bacterium]|nr:glycosyltransferase family 39 protein [Cryomorphaceae bacterium]